MKEYKKGDFVQWTNEAKKSDWYEFVRCKKEFKILGISRTIDGYDEVLKLDIIDNMRTPSDYYYKKFLSSWVIPTNRKKKLKKILKINEN